MPTVGAFLDSERREAIERMRARQHDERDGRVYGVVRDAHKAPYSHRVIGYVPGRERLPRPGDVVSDGVVCVARMMLNVSSFPTLFREPVPDAAIEVAREAWAA